MLTIPRRAVVVTRALGARDLGRALEAAGVGGELLCTDTARPLLDDDALWWGALEAGLPEPGKPDVGPWIDALPAYVAAIDDWTGREEMEATIDTTYGDAGPALRDGDPLLVHLRAASALLGSLGLPTIPPDLSVHRVDAGPMSMAYDSWGHRLKASPTVEDLSLPVAAAVLLHELVHVDDFARMANALGIPLRRLALTLDALPVGTAVAIQATLEDHAYAMEIAALEPLGIHLPDPATTPTDAEGRILQLLAILHAARPASPRWLSHIDQILVRNLSAR